MFQPQKDTVPVLKPPPSMISGSHDEQRAFDFFMHNTACQFAGQYDIAQQFWHIFIPRSALNDPLIYKGCVAMGSKHEATFLGSNKSSDLAEKTHAVIISTMARNLSQMRVDVALLGCVMLMGYANLCEEVPATAAIHFSLGLKIMREQTYPGQNIVGNPTDTYVDPNFREMFAELELATVLFAVPLEAVEIIAPPQKRPAPLPTTFESLTQAKDFLMDILQWLIYTMVIYRSSPLDLAASVTEIDEVLAVWRQTLIKYSIAIAAIHPGLYLKARKMMFQYKLFGMCRGAAKNDIFIDACRFQVLSVDFSQEHVTSILCTMKNVEVFDDGWRPFASKLARRNNEDELDIWPRGGPVGHNASTQIIRITLGD